MDKQISLSYPEVSAGQWWTDAGLILATVAGWAGIIAVSVGAIIATGG